jgi:2-oxoisovalerate dehydrogenase E1 component beta subunit
VGQRGGVFRATLGLFDKYGPERVIDSPLAELSIVGVGIGAALYGMHPVCEIQFADFIYPAFNQIVNEAAKMCYRSNGDWTVPMVIRAPYGGGIGGALYHSQSIEGFFAHIPGLKVAAPSNPYDAKGLLKSAIRDPNPVLFLEPKKGYRLIRGEVPGGDYTVPLGPANVSRIGQDISVFAYGMMHYYALQAAADLEQEGIDVEVVDLRTLKPLDIDTIVASVKKTGRLVGLTEAYENTSFINEVLVQVNELAFDWLDAPMVRVAAANVPVPRAEVLEDLAIPNTQRIVEACRKVMR